jgi:hypothetical protein
LPRRDPPRSKLYSSCVLLSNAVRFPLIRSRRARQHTAKRGKLSPHNSVSQFFETGRPLIETSLAEYSDRNNGAASTKERDERDCPDGVSEQCRSDSHAYGHDEHDCGRNNSNKSVHGAL